MPVGKYYCDYCDKEFQDNAAARKRHLQSGSHLRNRAQWYQNVQPTYPVQYPGQYPFAYPSFSQISQPCSAFLRNGFCPYGDSCKYWHLVPINQSPVSNNGIVGNGMSGINWGNLPPSLRHSSDTESSSVPFVDWG